MNTKMNPDQMCNAVRGGIASQLTQLVHRGMPRLGTWESFWKNLAVRAVSDSYDMSTMVQVTISMPYGEAFHQEFRVDERDRMDISLRLERCVDDIMPSIVMAASYLIEERKYDARR